MKKAGPTKGQPVIREEKNESKLSYKRTTC